MQPQQTAPMEALKAVFILGAVAFVVLVVVATVIYDQFHHTAPHRAAVTSSTLALATTSTAAPSVDAMTLAQVRTDVEASAADDGASVSDVTASGLVVDIDTPLYRKDSNVETAIGLCNTANVDLNSAGITSAQIFVKAGSGGDLAFSMPASDDHPDGYCRPSYGLSS